MFLIDDILILAGSALLGGLVGAAIAYIDSAIKWFRNFWNTHDSIRRNCLAIGVLIKQGGKALKEIFVQNKNKEEEISAYREIDDEGEEISNLGLSSEANEFLEKHGYIVLETYGF